MSKNEKSHCDSCYFSRKTTKPHTFFCNNYGHTVYDIDCCIHYTNKTDVEEVAILCDICHKIIPIQPDGFLISTICQNKKCKHKILCYNCVDKTTQLCKTCSYIPPVAPDLRDWMHTKKTKP